MPRQDLPALRTVRLLWIAVTAVTLIVAGKSFHDLSVGAIHPSQPPLMTFYYSIAFVAAGILAVSLILPGVMYRKAAARLRDELRDRPDQDRLAALLPAFLPSFVLGISLCLSVSFFGSTLGQLGFEPMMILPFFVVGTLFAAIRFPSERAILAVLDKSA